MRLEYVLTDIQELAFQKNLTEDVQLEIQTRTNYRVYYTPDASSCMCELTLELFPVEHEDKLNVKYRANSIFNLFDVELNDDTKKDIHIETYNRVFPLCASHIKSFLSTVDMFDIQIKPIDFAQTTIIIDD